MFEADLHILQKRSDFSTRCTFNFEFWRETITDKIEKNGPALKGGEKIQ